MIESRVDLAERTLLFRRLSLADRRRSASKVARVAAHPLLMVLPRLVRITGCYKVVTALTFWGGELDVILPELVSTKIWRYGCCDEDVCLYLLHRLDEGAVFIDVGAHIGFFTLLGSHLVGSRGTVLAFEPTPGIYRYLEHNVRTHADHRNVQLFDVAVANEDAELTFHDYGIEASAFNSVYGSRSANGQTMNSKTIRVRSRRVDDVLGLLVVNRVDMIKIDAESSELQVLNGAMETIRNHHPDIVLEVGDYGVEGAPQSRDLIAWLVKQGYAPYEVHDGRIVRYTPKERYAFANLLFLYQG